VLPSHRYIQAYNVITTPPCSTELYCCAEEGKFIRFEVLTAETIKGAIFWDKIPYSRVED
jgi:hypothetical protein